MVSFKNDYSEGVHPKILEKLIENNLEQSDGYGEDRFTLKAISLIKKHLYNENVDIHFISGGTLTNLIAISSFLKPHQAVISPKTGHIYVHETGAIESTGHKVIPVDCPNGKINIEQIETQQKEHHFEHMVKPGLVYISQPTELGTIYSKDELNIIYSYCKSNNLLLYIDGARLASAITSKNSTITLEEYGTMCDAFYIGGTKNGAMFGEALVICNNRLKEDFKYFMKQKGALMAKGRFLGIQFLALFEDNLFYELGAHANKMSNLLISKIRDLGYRVLMETESNQVFPIFPIPVLEELEKEFLFYRWGNEENNHCPVRLVCSWATTEDHVLSFVNKLKSLK